MIYFILALGLVWGICEGMTMTQFTDPNYRQNLTQYEAGIRSHKWFGFYHALDMLTISFAFLVGDFYRLSTCKDYLLVFGAIILGWELKEVGYGLARWNRLDETEHFDFMDLWSIQITKTLTVWLHIIRVIIGAGLIFGGYLL